MKMSSNVRAPIDSIKRTYHLALTLDITFNFQRIFYRQTNKIIFKTSTSTNQARSHKSIGAVSKGCHIPSCLWGMF